jgi:hypothetical protein
MHGNGAPRDAVLNPWRSQEELGGVFLGHRVYLTAKARGEKSMPEKWGSLEDAKGAAPQGPRDRAKATLLEPQSPAVECRTLAATASTMRRYQGWSVQLSQTATSDWQGDGQRGH